MDAKTGAAIGLGSALIVSLVVIVGMTGGFGSLSTTQDKAPQSGNGTASGDVVKVNKWGVDGTVTLPLTISSGKVYKFNPGVEVQNYGDYDDFKISDATDGLQAGVDYRVESLNSSKKVTFSDVKHKSGKYKFVLVDNSNPRDYHYSFWQEKMPKTVKLSFAENDKDINLDDNAAFDQWQSYGTETVAYKKESNNRWTSGSDLSFSSNGTKTVTLEDWVPVSSGAAYLGDVSITSFNDGEGISKVELSVMVDGEEKYSKTLKDGSTGPLSDSTSFKNAMTSEDLDLSRNPHKATDNVKVHVEVTGEFDTADNTAGDGEIGPGESILSIGADDIFGTAIGDGSAESFTG